MTNEQKARELIEEIYPSTSMGDYGMKEQLLLEAMKWKDENFEKILDYIEICYGVFQFNEREKFIKKIKELYYGE